MDSDDQNSNKKCEIDDDDDDDVLVEYKVDTKCCDKINSIEGSQYLDANGNTVSGDNQSKNNEFVECDCVGVEIDSQVKSTLSESNEVHKKDDSVMKKLMALALDDYGELMRKLDHAEAFVGYSSPVSSCVSSQRESEVIPTSL